jgi:hypothetical protein
MISPSSSSKSNDWRRTKKTFIFYGNVSMSDLSAGASSYSVKKLQMKKIVNTWGRFHEDYKLCKS